MSFIVPFPGGGIITLTYTDADNYYNPSSTQTSFSFAGKSIGAAKSSRYVIVLVNQSNITSLTIGGIAATQVNTFFWIANVPTGTTATIAATTSAGVTSFPIIVYAMNDPNGLTPYDTNSGLGPKNINIPQGGCAIGLGSNIVNPSPTITWSGLTKDHDEKHTVVLTLSHSGASLASLNSQTVAASCSFDATNQFIYLCSWSP